MLKQIIIQGSQFLLLSGCWALAAAFRNDKQTTLKINISLFVGKLQVQCLGFPALCDVPFLFLNGWSDGKDWTVTLGGGGNKVFHKFINKTFRRRPLLDESYQNLNSHSFVCGNSWKIVFGVCAPGW